MKFSLIGVQKREGNTVSGNWIQNHVGTLESATQVARETEATNSNKIDVAVVTEVSYSSTGEYHSFLTRLDTRRNLGANRELSESTITAG